MWLIMGFFCNIMAGRGSGAQGILSIFETLLRVCLNSRPFWELIRAGLAGEQSAAALVDGGLMPLRASEASERIGIGGRHLSFPATPPDKQVRIRRFE
jgi:hypothetical protein